MWLKNLFYKIRFWFYQKYTDKLMTFTCPYKKDRVLIFNEEFIHNTWDEDHPHEWRVGESWGLVHPAKPNVWYGPPEIVEESNESLAKFTVKYNPREFEIEGVKTMVPFEISLLSSVGQWQYGRFECRCTIPYDRGVWPAFWLWGSTWPPEIDVFELYGDKDGNTAGRQEINLHYGEFPKNKHIKVQKINLDPSAFHEFAVEWTPDKIEFFTDGIKVYEFANKKILDKWFNVPTANMAMVINHSIQEQFVSNLDTEYYSEFYVDYIRVYEKKGINQSQ